ncbi:histidine phosphatase family protein [Niallia sp. Krafla_26]|uniref:histidine phosphatase family protein n=1 Tax=Niallia sp. Krafla_26 TaxID=3064703 RepID=UPI003D17D9D3
MQITLIRHLPTEWNVNTWLQGRRDIDILPVTEEVQEQIELNKRELKELAPFQFILASTLKRTQQTASLYGFETTIESLLDELDFGKFEGRTKKELMDEMGEDWLENPRNLILGENLTYFESRIIHFLEKYKEASNILIFGHGAWIRAFLSFVTIGHINQMNKMIVQNNECITIQFNTRTLLA